MIYDVIIIGSGPAGLTAAIYTTRDNLKTLVIAGTKWGGQLQLTTLIENFPGFPQGIQGPELMANMRKQAERFGAEIVNVDFTSGDFFPLRASFAEVATKAEQGSAGQAKSPFRITAGGKEYSGRTIIIATGTDTTWLGVPGEKEKIGHGVSACAPCDAPFFKNKKVIVIGGGNAAMEEALILTNFAKEVTIVYRSEKFTRASRVMVDKVEKNPKIKIFFNSQVVEVLGTNKVEKVKLKDTKTNKISEMLTDGIFVAIRRAPNSGMLKGIELDKDGYIKVHDHIKTNIDGIFVAGDVHNKDYQQAITAAGFGAMAALQAERWLEDRK